MQETAIENYDFHSSEASLPVMNLRVGSKLLHYIVTEDCSDEFVGYCVNFFYTLANDFFKRFLQVPDKNPHRVWKVCQCLIPQNVVSLQFREANPDCFDEFLEVFQHFLHQHKSLENNVRQAWELLSQLQFSDESLLRSDKVVEFWEEVREFGEENNHKSFERIAIMALTILSISHANAHSERVFSTQNRTKTKDRNCYDVTTVNERLLTNEAVKRSGGPTRYQPSPRVQEIYKSKKFYKNKYAPYNV